MKRIIGFVLAMIIFVIVLGFWVFNKENTIATNDKISLRLAWLPGATFAGDYMALSQGYWEKEGLEVKLHSGGFELDAIKFVATGGDIIGVTSGPQLIQARAEGVPVVAIGAIIPQSPIGWVTKAGSGIKVPKDFIGKKIGAQFGTHAEITFEALMGKMEISLNSLERIPVSFDPRPFITDSVDVLPVYIVDQPVDLRSKGIELNIIDPREYGVAFWYGNVYFTTDKTAKERPEMLQKFLRGANRGWIEAEQKRDIAIAAILKAAPDLDSSILRKKLDSTFNFIMKGSKAYSGIAPTELKKWEYDIALLKRYGDLVKPFDAKTLFNNEFLFGKGD